MSEQPQQFDNSKLDKLVLKGAKEYALQDYERATESFSDACQLFSELNDGADSPRLLYYYGRALYQVGVSKSDVFGSGKDDDKEEGAEDADEEEKKKTPKKDEKSNKFQFEEDEVLEKQQQENNDDAEKAEEDNKQEEEAPEQSDLEAAWEILDTARALFIKEIEKAKAQEDSEESKEEDKKTEDSKPEDADKAPKKTTKQAKIEELEKGLADTFDILGEVSLESEDFNQAVQDFTQSLLLKKRLYEPTSTHLSEGYFKLSLAYEFCVVEKDTPEPTTETLAIPPTPSSIPETDKASANPQNKYILLAISAMEQAISVVTEREKQGLNQDKTLLKDLISRQNDLKLALKQDTQAEESQKKEVLEGIIGAEASSADALKQTLLQAITKANDVSGLVRKSKKKKQQQSAPTTTTTTSSSSQPSSLKRELESSEKSEETSEKKTKLDQEN